MKKSIAVITAVVVLGVAGISFAQMDDKGKEMMKDKAWMMDGKGGMMGMMGGKGMMGMMKMCQSMMNKPSLVAVGDGVVVLSGKKLYKYDANLNLVKEAEIKVDDAGMMGDKGMMDMMKMCQQMMGNGTNSDNKTPTANADEHAAHHPQQ